MTTCADLIQETRGYLLTGTRERQNLLSGAHDASTTTFTFTHSLDFDTGDVLAVDLELVYVWSVTSNTALVQRGFQGSTAAAHSDGALVTVSPVFSDFRIFKALNAELESLSSPQNGLFKIATVSPTFNSATVGYDLTSVTDLLDIYAVYYDEVGPEKIWPEVHRWTLRRNMSTADFASGFQVLIGEGQPGTAIRVVYKAPYTQFSTVADDVQTVTGLSAHANDIPPLGAAYRLVSAEEVQRNFSNSQGDTRRSGEVPPGAQLGSSKGIAVLWKRRVDEEAARLSRAYPYLKRGTGY